MATKRSDRAFISSAVSSGDEPSCLCYRALMGERLSLSHRNGTVGPERRRNRTVAIGNSILFHGNPEAATNPFVRLD
jgi:hypothetical protein